VEEGGRCVAQFVASLQDVLHDVVDDGEGFEEIISGHQQNMAPFLYHIGELHGECVLVVE